MKLATVIAIRAETAEAGRVYGFYTHRLVSYRRQLRMFRSPLSFIASTMSPNIVIASAKGRRDKTIGNNEYYVDLFDRLSSLLSMS